ncbi:MAG: glycoside hydrolase family 6 protein [Acidimicrobiales bacterium]
MRRVGSFRRSVGPPLVLVLLASVGVVAPTGSAAADAAVEAESMTVTAGAGAPYADTAASGGQALILWANGRATATITTDGLREITVRARGDLCSGAPRMDVRVGGTVVLSTEVRSTTWADHGVAVAVPAGTQLLTIDYTNDTKTRKCDRNLRLDRVTTVAGTATTTTTTAPTTTTKTTAPTTTTTTPSTTTTTTTPPSPPPPTGLPGASLYVDPSSHAAREADALRASDPPRAALFDKIAGQAQADWFGDWVPTAELASRVDARVDTMAAAGALPVFVAYAIPVRDCGSYSAGGIGTPDGYRAWVREMARGMAGRPAAVVLEPDALAMLPCLTAEQQQTRLDLLADAVRTLAAGGASVYLDAGHSTWVPADTMADRLAAAGIAGARGFSLNVSNFQRTGDEVAYGRALSQRLGGKPFVVDTSRNGLGPYTGPEYWCNPPDRALGERPTTTTGVTGLDALLWVKRPGESDGTCRGGPPAGTWWPDYAAGLAQRAGLVST